MGKAKQYDKDFKIQAVKLTQEIGSTRTAKELGIPVNTLYGWMRAYKEGRLECGVRTPGNAMTLSEEVAMLRKKVKQQEKEIRRLNELNDFLEVSSAYFSNSAFVMDERSICFMTLLYQKTIEISMVLRTIPWF